MVSMGSGCHDETVEKKWMSYRFYCRTGLMNHSKIVVSKLQIVNCELVKGNNKSNEKGDYQDIKSV